MPTYVLVDIYILIDANLVENHVFQKYYDGLEEFGCQRDKTYEEKVSRGLLGGGDEKVSGRAVAAAITGLSWNSIASGVVGGDVHQVAH